MKREAKIKNWQVVFCVSGKEKRIGSGVDIHHPVPIQLRERVSVRWVVHGVIITVITET